MALLKNGKPSEDTFIAAYDNDELPAGSIIVSLKQWQEHRAELISRTEDIGVLLRSDEKAESIADDLDNFAVIALEFPAFGDGRAYSTATLLRRLGFAGELRAVGEVLLEQLHFMHRVGFNAFDVKSKDAAREWEIAAADLSVWYQHTSDGRDSVMELRHSRN